MPTVAVLNGEILIDYRKTGAAPAIPRHQDVAVSADQYTTSNHWRSAKVSISEPARIADAVQDIEAQFFDRVNGRGKGGVGLFVHGLLFNSIKSIVSDWSWQVNLFRSIRIDVICHRCA